MGVVCEDKLRMKKALEARRKQAIKKRQKEIKDNKLIKKD